VDARAGEILRVAREGGGVRIDGALERFAPRGVALAEVFQEPQHAPRPAGHTTERAAIVAFVDDAKFLTCPPAQDMATM